MKEKNMTKKLSALALTFLLMSGCHPVYYTADFKPSTERGVEAFARANKKIYPRQALENPELYRNETVAWAGIVKDISVFQSRMGPAARILLEHHYFDWFEDHGAQPEFFFLSPRGEGDFAIVLGPGEFDEQNIKRVPAGLMVVAVGKPKVMSDPPRRKELFVLTEHYEFIKKTAYRMDVYDYGREGEPIKSVPGSSRRMTSPYSSSALRQGESISALPSSFPATTPP
jgi:hypothetical protein